LPESLIKNRGTPTDQRKKKLEEKPRRPKRRRKTTVYKMNYPREGVVDVKRHGVLFDFFRDQEKRSWGKEGQGARHYTKKDARPTDDRVRGRGRALEQWFNILTGGSKSTS